MTRTLIAGSIEYLVVSVTSDTLLDSQPVAFSFDHDQTWVPAVWQGSAASNRNVSVLLDGTMPVGMYQVNVRITDTPEIPIMNAGPLYISEP